MNTSVSPSSFVVIVLEPNTWTIEQRPIGIGQRYLNSLTPCFRRVLHAPFLGLNEDCSLKYQTDPSNPFLTLFYPMVIAPVSP
jgi:hypothetical protein